jgi:hypothetical protein
MFTCNLEYNKKNQLGCILKPRIQPDFTVATDEIKGSLLIILYLQPLPRTNNLNTLTSKALIQTSLKLLTCLYER